MAFVVKLNDAVCIISTFYFHFILDRLRFLHAFQVASSAVGRWFELDGSGAKGERKGSRFTVGFFSLSRTC